MPSADAGSAGPAHPHRDQRRAIRQGPKRMGFQTQQVNQVARFENPRRVGRAQLDAALDALDRDFAGRLVFFHLVAGQQHHANDFQLFCLENGRRPGTAELFAQWKNADNLSRLGVCLGHWFAPKRVIDLVRGNCSALRPVWPAALAASELWAQGFKVSAPSAHANRPGSPA